jgi:hypothetical protein
LLAILVGRLGLTALQVEKEYMRVINYISSASIDNITLDRMLKTLVKKYTGDSETLMYDPSSPTARCKV